MQGDVKKTAYSNDFVMNMRFKPEMAMNREKWRCGIIHGERLTLIRSEMNDVKRIVVAVVVWLNTFSSKFTTFLRRYLCALVPNLIEKYSIEL